MNSATLEHVNVTVTDADRTAALLCDLFGWRIRWQGPAIGGGRSVHVGTDDSYIAVYTPGERPGDSVSPYVRRGGLNHIGVLVDNLDEVERRVLAAGYKTHNHAEYEPGRRFYFNDGDGVEYEVVHYG